MRTVIIITMMVVHLVSCLIYKIVMIKGGDNMKPIQVLFQRYNTKTRKYETKPECTVTNSTIVYEWLARDLVHKKLQGCTYIKSITCSNNYDGTQDISVRYHNLTRRLYTVEM